MVLKAKWNSTGYVQFQAADLYRLEKSFKLKIDEAKGTQG